MKEALAGLLALSLVLESSIPAGAQSLLPIAVGQRVRIWTASAEAMTGRVAALARDTIQIDVDGRDRATVAAMTIRKVEVSGGKKSRGAGAKASAIRGALIGGALGAILLGWQHEDVGDDGASVGEAVALGLWSGALFGGAIGAGVGAARAGDQWTQVFP
ncbi:MAG: hypothetical protein ABI983_04860 [Acidobacteriota bacterium]